MESGQSFNFIDGSNLSYAELKFRLSIMGLDNIENITDFDFIANLYNDILISRDIRYVSKIKCILDDDKESSNFINLLNKKRSRPSISEIKDNNGFKDMNRQESNTFNSHKNG